MSSGSKKDICRMDCDVDKLSVSSGNEFDDLDSDFDDDVVVDAVVPSETRPSLFEFDCEILEAEEVKREMDTAVESVCAIIRYPRTICRMLLHHYKWNKDGLLERYFGCANAEEFFLSADIAYPFENLAKAKASSDKLDVCSICCEFGMLIGLGCEHRFCKTCWEAYLSSKIGDGQAYIHCPEHGCSVIVDDEIILMLLQTEEIKKSYRHLIINSYVQFNTLLRWCPATDCGRVLKVGHSNAQPVKCNCGFNCCFACGEGWHEPVTCHLLKLWLKKCSDDSETFNWLSANTKECPKCRVTIEKDGGCNHVMCKNSSCKMEFCWICLGPWEPHSTSWYSCNRYNDTLAKEARCEQERSRAALHRYLHYYNRYMNHQQSLKLEHRLYSTVRSKMERMQQSNMSWVEVQFLLTAVDVLSECRRSLMYTYAFAFFLIKNNQSAIFEDNQRDLEIATEQLSEVLERDLDHNMSTLKQTVQDKYRYVDHRRTILLRHCSEGFEQGFWRFNV